MITYVLNDKFEIADYFSFIVFFQMGIVTDYYELVMEDHPRLSKRHSDHLTKGLTDFDEVSERLQTHVSQVENI